MRERRDDLIEKALDDVLEHGLAGLSLRPLAERIGTSARLLVYHFGSKEGLLEALMEALQARTQKAFLEADAHSEMAAGNGVMLTFWKRLTQPANRPHLRLQFEVQALALQHPETFGRYLERSASSWLTLIEASLPPSRDKQAVATLCSAVMDGLLMDYLATGDKRRTTKALDVFTAMMRGRASKA